MRVSSPGVRRQLLADSALVAVTFIWGSTFVLVKDIIEQVSPMLFLAMRFALGALVLAAVAVPLGKWRGFSMRELRWGALTGLMLWAGYAFQTVGLQWTTASNGGFITGLSVVMVPLFGVLLLRQRPHRAAMAGVVLSTTGLALLTLHIEQGLQFNLGDLLVLGCAVAFALQVITIAHAAAWADPLRLALVQVGVAALLDALAAIVFEHPISNVSPQIWAGAAFLGIAATGLAFTIQVTVQRFTTAMHTALVFTLEPVFAAIFGVWLQGDRFGWLALLGAAFILGGMLVAELGPQFALARRNRATNRRPYSLAEVPPIQPGTDRSH